MKHTTKRYLFGILMLSVLLVLSGCGKPSPDQVADSFLESWKAADTGASLSYLESDEAMKDSDMPDNLEEAKKAAKTEEEKNRYLILEKVMTSLSYEDVTVEKEEDGKAVVSAKVTTINGAEAMVNTVKGMFGLTFSEEAAQMSEEELSAGYMKIMLDCFSDPELKPIDGKLVLHMKETEDGWKILLDEEAMNTLTGGMTGALNDISEMGE